jgi:Protein of unknown function (DUF4038)/Putative collagen-binding domain of a collagenase
MGERWFPLPSHSGTRFHAFCRDYRVVSAIILALISASATLAQAPRLRVTPNHRYLEYENGKPFFYLGDTAWALFHNLNREDATLYLTNRADKGFSVIQATVLAAGNGWKTPNAYGDIAFIDNDVTRPNEAYFKHVDFIVDKAASLGLFIGMLPCWGNYWASPNAVFTPQTALQYGRFLGARYKDKPIIWILGGDHSITDDDERAIVDALAAGLTEGDGGAHLKTFHPFGPGDSSYKLNGASWLDFNMYQSSHSSRDHDNGLYAEHDYALSPQKPTLDGENRYEQIPVGFHFRGMSGLVRFDDSDVRQSAYWSILAGACGHTYGDNNIWQMFEPKGHADEAPVQDTGGRNRLGDPWMGLPGGGLGANIPWQEAMNHPGAFQMGFVRRLFESLPFTKMIPDQKIILNGPLTGGAKVRAARSSDGSFAIIYSPFGEAFSIDKSIIKAARVKEIWYDPRYGIAYEFHQSDDNGIQTYTPPTSGRGYDWILLLEDAKAGYPLPGIKP